MAEPEGNDVIATVILHRVHSEAAEEGYISRR